MREVQDPDIFDLILKLYVCMRVILFMMGKIVLVLARAMDREKYNFLIICRYLNFVKKKKKSLFLCFPIWSRVIFMESFLWYCFLCFLMDLQNCENKNTTNINTFKVYNQLHTIVTFNVALVLCLMNDSNTHVIFHLIVFLNWCYMRVRMGYNVNPFTEKKFSKHLSFFNLTLTVGWKISFDESQQEFKGLGLWY